MKNTNVARIEQVNVDIHYYISGPIGDAEKYIDLIDLLYSRRDGDVVYIHLNTPGGSLDTTIQILNAIEACKGTVVTIADGSVASAGTLILLSGRNIVVNPFSYIMFHDGTERMGGKLNENLKQAQFVYKFAKQLFNDVYSPFLTRKEIEDVASGKDLWFTSEEMINRLKKLEKDDNE